MRVDRRYVSISRYITLVFMQQITNSTQTKCIFEYVHVSMSRVIDIYYLLHTCFLFDKFLSQVHLTKWKYFISHFSHDELFPSFRYLHRPRDGYNKERIAKAACYTFPLKARPRRETRMITLSRSICRIC